MQQTWKALVKPDLVVHFHAIARSERDVGPHAPQEECQRRRRGKPPAKPEMAFSALSKSPPLTRQFSCTALYDNTTSAMLCFALFPMLHYLWRVRAHLADQILKYVIYMPITFGGCLIEGEAPTTTERLDVGAVDFTFSREVGFCANNNNRNSC